MTHGQRIGDMATLTRHYRMDPTVATPHYGAWQNGSSLGPSAGEWPQPLQAPWRST
jgi:hypothetical protein